MGVIGLLLIPSLSYAIAIFLQLVAVEKIGQTKTALFLYLEPITGIFGAVILLNETLNLTQIFGTTIVILSLVASTYFNNKTKNNSCLYHPRSHKNNQQGKVV